jgi:hypothetical protein
MPDSEDPSLHNIRGTNIEAFWKIRTYSNKYWALLSRDAKNNDETPPEPNFLIKVLYLNALPSSPLHKVVRAGQFDAVQYGIATDANIEGKNLLGNTPLQEAVRWRSLQVLKLLLASGAAIGSQNNVGDTVLHTASSLGLVDFAEQPLRHEVDTDVPNYH